MRQWALTRLTDFVGWPVLGRILVLAVALGLAVAAGVLWNSGDRAPVVAEAPRLASRAPEVRKSPVADRKLPISHHIGIDAEREAKRFARVDKDKDKWVSRDEFLALRRRAFAKLDTDGDGVLSFEEAAVKTIAKFTSADANGDRKLTPVEFAATAAQRRLLDDN